MKRIIKDNKTILAKLESIDEHVSMIIRSLEGCSYNITRFCNALGISRYQLKKLWLEYNLPIPEPKRSNGKDPTYTVHDLEVVREIINP